MVTLKAGYVSFHGICAALEIESLKWFRCGIRRLELHMPDRFHSASQLLWVRMKGSEWRKETWIYIWAAGTFIRPLGGRREESFLEIRLVGVVVGWSRWVNFESLTSTCWLVTPWWWGCLWPDRLDMSGTAFTLPWTYTGWCNSQSKMIPFAWVLYFDYIKLVYSFLERQFC